MQNAGCCWQTALSTVRSLFNVAHLNTLTDIVTDSRLDEAARTQLEQLETRLTLAS